jgi:hypothetical protein
MGTWQRRPLIRGAANVAASFLPAWLDLGCAAGHTKRHLPPELYDSYKMGTGSLKPTRTSLSSARMPKSMLSIFIIMKDRPE